MKAFDYSFYLLEADNHIRKAYHYGETKQFERCLNELTNAIVAIRLSLAEIKIHVESVNKQRKETPK